MKNYIKLILFLLLIACLYTCTTHRKMKTEKTMQVTAVTKPVNSVLYYSGIIEPIRTVMMTSPADGVMNDVQFHFGDEVKKGQPLFFISSEKFQSDYKTALMQYIKAKTEYANHQTEMRESDFLHKNSLISDDDYKSKQTGFYNARLSLVQAKDALDNLQKQIDLQGKNFYDLKIEDIDKITQVLHEQNALRQIHVVSPANGVVLLPVKEEGSGELKKIQQGDSVRQGDVIAVIGDVSGLTVHVSVGELSVNQLKQGQSVKVTGMAFPDVVLDGKITAIDRQGESMQGGLPAFSVEVVVPVLTREQQNRIHVGMTAKVAIELDNAAKMTVPIKAIIQKDGKTYLNVKNEKSGKVHLILVKTGETTLDSVTIDSGLLPGENIVFTD